MTTSDELKMSASTRKLLAKARNMVPPMLESFHKGQLGRVAVIGGSEDYTGAPYFSAMASARLGSDMSHVICTPAAAAVIKTYSPNLMVHPLMRQSPSSAHSGVTPSDPPDASKIASRIIDEILPRLHVLVIGPGLGRDPLMQDTCAHVLAAACKNGIPVVLDADALGIVSSKPELVKGQKEVILTPNVVEFGRLWKAMGMGDPEASGVGKGGETDQVEKLARKLGGVTIVQKGAKDYISNGETTLVSDLEGGRKRSGGQGDTLTGSIGTFLAWRKAYLDKIWDVKGDLDENEMIGLAAFAGSSITRECSRLAFATKGRSLQASDLTEQVHIAFLNLIGEDDDLADSKL